VIAWLDSRFAVTGALTIDTAKDHQRLPSARSTQEGAWVVDMAQVESVDSAAVSLMLSWMRQAGSQGRDVSFIHVPENLRSLVDLYGLSEVLPLNYS